MRRPDVLIQRLEQAMVTMDATSRAVFLAHRVDSLPYDQIATWLGLSIAEVERHLAAAILHSDRMLTSFEAQDRD